MEQAGSLILTIGSSITGITTAVPLEQWQQWQHHSTASASIMYAPVTPSAPMLNVASASGWLGEAMILATRVSPRPLRSCRRVVVACAMMLPPTALSCGLGGWGGEKEEGLGQWKEG